MRGKAVLAELLLARISLRMNDAEVAASHCQAALEQLAEPRFPAVAIPGRISDGRNRAGRRTKAQAAYQSYSRARDAIEQVRGKLRAEELKIAFFQNKLEVYENLVDLCLHRPDGAEEAFGYIEQAKSRALMDLLMQSVRVSTTADPGQSELVRSIRNFREELNWYYNLIEREQLRPEERSPGKNQATEQQARAREADLMRALKEATRR